MPAKAGFFLRELPAAIERKNADYHDCHDEDDQYNCLRHSFLFRILRNIIALQQFYFTFV
jgi:hypothetical protein